jgi:hypothetical protein
VLLIAASTFLAETNSRPNLRALDVKGMAISYLTLLSLRAYMATPSPWRSCSPD